MKASRRPRARGVYGGRKPRIDTGEIRRSAGAELFGIDRDCSLARYWAGLRLLGSGSHMMTAGVAVPIEALATLRRRLAALPDRRPQGVTLLSSPAELRD
jgi:hypothetical protein